MSNEEQQAKVSPGAESPHHIGEEIVRDTAGAIGSRFASGGQALLQHIRRHPVSAGLAGAAVLLLLVASLRAVDEPEIS